MNYEVIVENVGCVYSGDDKRHALLLAESYQISSMQGYGRVAGEPISVLCDGEVVWEYTPETQEE